MATKGMYKLDDGNCHPTNCFPARSLLQPHREEGDEHLAVCSGAGHWEVARQTAERMKIEWWFGSRSTRIQWKGPDVFPGPHSHPKEKTLTGTLLMNMHHVKSPSHLCSVDISNQNFTSAKEEDFEPFDSVAYINATENLLTLEVFRKFLALRELDLSLNGLRNLKVNAGDFPHLEVLDLSCNNLSPEDVWVLGILPRLKVLHLTANGLRSLLPDLALPDSHSASCPRFPALEVLFLDDNQLSHPDVFVSLANLRSLKQLNLDRNGIKEVPYLHLAEDARFSIHPLSAKSGIREGLRTRKSAEAQCKRDATSRLGEPVEYVIGQNSMDLDRTDIFIQTSSPGPSLQGGTPVSRPISKISSPSVGQEFVLPLMELRYLSLANNQIEHEEDLLAVALFPSLTELTFYGNPFTTSRSGDPPLLTSFLQDKLGIKLVRKKISKLEKPRIFIPARANRKVISPLPKVRKHPPMLEAPLETTFWDLWTGTEPELDTGASLEAVEPLPPIGQFSAEKPSSVPYLPFQEAPDSELYSVATSPSQEGAFGLVPGVQTSSDHLCGPEHKALSVGDQIQFATLTPSRSLLGEPSQSGFNAPTVSPSPKQGEPSQVDVVQGWPPTVSPSPDQGESSQSGLTPPTASPSVEQDQFRPLMPTEESTASENKTPVGMPLTEKEMPGLVAPPSSSGQEAYPSERFPPSRPPATEEDPSQVLQPVSSAAGQPVPSPRPPSEQQTLSEPLPPPGSPTGEQDLVESLSPIRSTSVGQELPEASPPNGSPGQVEPMDSLGNRDQGVNLSENALPSPCGLVPQVQDLLAPAPLPRSPSKDRDLSQPCPSLVAPSAKQDHSGSAPLASLSFREQIVLSESVPPTESPAREPDLTKPLPCPDAQIWPESSPPSAEQNQMDSLPAAAPAAQDPNWPEAELLIQSSSTQREPPKSVLDSSFLSSVQGSAGGVSGAKLLPEKPGGSERSSKAWSSSRDLQMLFERELSLSSPSGEKLGIRSPSDYLTAEEMDSFFMTQVAEDSDSLETLGKEETPCEEVAVEPKRKWPPVPERYKGYEELLNGPMDPDFIEPRGIEQNVKALERALRHPLVYREPRARLDSFQKPYVPRDKKVLRVPAPPVQKTKAQMLEELLQQMRTPTNVVEVPLVCVLRRKKSNWREYREALALLRDFQKRYKATMAISSETKSIPRTQKPNSHA